jgi:hypothetical protein
MRAVGKSNAAPEAKLKKLRRDKVAMSLSLDRPAILLRGL